MIALQIGCVPKVMRLASWRTRDHPGPGPGGRLARTFRLRQGACARGAWREVARHKWLKYCQLRCLPSAVAGMVQSQVTRRKASPGLDGRGGVSELHRNLHRNVLTPQMTSQIVEPGMTPI